MDPITRDSVAPQLRDYETLGFNYVPYSIYTQTRRFRSASVNTDNLGYRPTETAPGATFRVEHVRNYPDFSLISGGSTVFGVGATSDSKTIASRLGSQRREPWLNLGIRSANLMQEQINFSTFILPSIQKVRNIVVFSGFNDIYLNASVFTPSFFDSIYWMQRHLAGWRKMEVENMHFSAKRKLLAWTAAFMTGQDYHDLLRRPLKDLFSKAQGMSPFSFDSDFNYETPEQKLTAAFERTFAFYAALKMAYGINIIFILQPFWEWTRKQLSPEEQCLFQEVARRQTDDTFDTFKKRFDKNKHRELSSALSDLADRYGLPYFDSNGWFDEAATKDFLFVDHAHLTDDGNALMANKICELLDSAAA